MEKESVQGRAVEEERQPKSKPEKEETLFDRRINWVKNHKVFSWVLLIAFASGVIGGIWGLMPKPVKDAVNDKLTNIGSSGDNEDVARVKGIINRYYADLESGQFRAANYFASHIQKYFLVSDLNPSEVDSYFITNGMEFLAPKSEIIDSNFIYSKDAAGKQTATLWVKFNCFRKSKKKYEYCLSRIEFVFDKDDRIISLGELHHEGLKFWNKELLFEGTVGKLPAVFNLVFDYTNKKISGTYYYPTRKNQTYDIAGSINGKRLEFVEYTNGKKTATCTLESKDQKSFSGTMFNTDGRQLKMTIRTAEFLFLEG